MAEHESLTEKISGVNSSSSSSSGSDDDKPSPVRSFHSKSFRLFGRDKPVHQFLGGGKPADIILWRNKKESGIVLGVGTAFWLFFVLLEYHLVTLVCHLLIVALATLFLWSHASVFIHKSPVHIPEVVVPEEWVLQVVSALRIETNRAFIVLRGVATGQDVKRFLGVVAGLWVLSVVGSWFNILTLFYILFLSLFTMPLMYERNEDQVDSFAEKAMVEIKKQYAVFDAKILSQIPIGGLKKD